MTGRRSLAPQFAVLTLFLISVGFQGPFTYRAVENLLHATKDPRIPFRIHAPDGTLTALEPEAQAAGLAKGDRPVSIEGHPLRGIAAIATTLDAHHAGDVIEVTALRNGVPVAARVRLAPQSGKPPPISEWILTLFVYGLTPLFCILLGFGVTFVRPRDPLAWLLLLLMLSFSEIAQSDNLRAAASWTVWARDGALAYHNLLIGSWPIWMLLFGQYFPDRVANRPWLRRTRWMLGVPLALLALLDAAIGVATVDDATALRGLATARNRVAGLTVLLVVAAIGTFFVSIFLKMRGSASCDDKRRLKLLYGGAAVSLTPLLFVILGAIALRKPLATVPDWIIISALVLLFLFPVTLAYVIVVERAMELRVVIRQGLQYALARRGVRLLQLAVSAVLLFLVLRVITEPGLRRIQQMFLLVLTLAVLISFRRLAERLHAWLDRRFFREAVNVEHVLSDLSDKVRTILEVEPLLETVTRTVSSALHVPRVAVLMRRNGDYAPALTLGYEPAPPQVKFPSRGPLAERLEQSREPLRVSHTRPEPWLDPSVEALGSELLLPLAANNRLLGFISLGPKLSEEPYSATDVRLLESVAAQTGLAIENSRLTAAVAHEIAHRERLNRELEIAREVQQRLLPQSAPPVEGLDYSGKCRPASSVGGDYYDFVVMAGGRLGIAIGDISGKGVSAALLMASLQASLRGLAIANPAALSALMQNLNRLVYETSPASRYATFFFGVYDPVSREFAYVNAGHNAPMIFRGAEVLRLEEGGLVMGLFDAVRYDQASVTLQPGDTMVLFTDGVSEAMNAADEEFGETRLMEAVRSGASLDASALIDHILETCDEFAAGAPQHDDMTLVVVRVK